MNKTKKKTMYKSADYHSSDGMMTYVWGPPIWHFLHTISFNYPTNPTQPNKVQYMNFVKSLRNVLPCKYCRINLTKNLKLNPITMETMESRNTFSRYIYQLHETINKLLNKTSGLSYDEIRDRYEHFRARCLPSSKTNLPISLVEKGCTNPLIGKKSKCILKIVPLDDPTPPFTINPECLPTRKLSRKKK